MQNVGHEALSLPIHKHMFLPLFSPPVLLISHSPTWLERIGWDRPGKNTSQISVAFASSKHPPPFVMKI